MKYAYNPLWTHPEARDRLEKVERFRPYSAIVSVQNGHVWAENGDGKTIDHGTDASTVIQAAHDSISSEGGKILLKSGIYILNSAINITQRAVTIEGENIGHVYAPLTEYDGVRFILGNPTIDGFVIDGGAGYFHLHHVFFGSTDAGGQTAGSCIKIIGGCPHVNLHNIYANGIYELVRSYAHALFFQDSISDLYWNGGGAVVLTGDNQSTIRNVTAVSNGGPPDFGIKITGADASITGTRIIDNVFRDCNTGIDIDIGTATVQNMIISRNFIVNYVDKGIYIRPMQAGGIFFRSIIAENIIQGDYVNSTYGIYADGGAGALWNLLLNNITFLNINSGIYIDNCYTAASFVVQNNTSVANKQYGIAANSLTCQNVIIQNNNLRSNTIGGINFPGGTPAGMIVFNNPGYNPQAMRTQVVGASPYTYTNVSGYIETVYVYGGSNISSLTLRGMGMVPPPSTELKTFALYPNDALTIVYVGAAPDMKIQPM